MHIGTYKQKELQRFLCNPFLLFHVVYVCLYFISILKIYSYEYLQGILCITLDAFDSLRLYSVVYSAMFLEKL